MSQTVERATQVIDLVAEGATTLNQIAEHFDVHRSTIFRQLQTLVRAGYLMHHADGSYSIGPRIVLIAQQALDNLDLRRVAFDEIRALHKRVGNTLHLAQLVEDRVMYIDKVEGLEAVRMYSRIGRTVRPNSSAVGKVILAQLPPSRRDAILRDVDWTPFTSTTLTTRESLDAELQAISENGWGVDNGEFEEFINCIAAPITNSTGTVVGALSISAIKVINDLDQLKAHLDDLLRTTRKISAELG